jgi:hypothetical protein
MSSRKLVVVGAVAAVGMSAALACGPFFPTRLLDDRAGTLAAAPVNSFAFEASRLVTPSDDLKAVEPPYEWYQPEDHRPALRAAAEAQSLSPAQARILLDMRQAASGDAAFEKGATLPAAVRLYTAGAVDFAHDQAAQAAPRFAAVLALSGDAPAARAVWAAFMLGKIRGLDGDIVGAAERFRQVRTLALGGLPDPLGLAVASFGEQARLHLAAAQKLPSADPAAVRELASAVVLYEEQAARGSDSGIQSLRMVAEQVMGDDARLAVAAADPLIQRLLIVYALARAQDPAMDLSYDDNAGYGLPTNAGAASGDARLVALADAIEKTATFPVEGADRLAVLAYGTGRYALAERLAGKASSPLASWIKAKLALQKGDLAGAAALYGEATRSLSDAPAGGTLEPDNARLLIGERGTLALARGEIVDALDHLYQAHYWADVAHIADRILTTDELKHFVDGAPTTMGDDAAFGWSEQTMASRLRNLLARRLMRDGRFDAATSYFTDPAVAQAALAYEGALDAAAHRWSGVARARSWYAAATLARQSGMALMGFEGAPDFAYWNGNLADGIGQPKLEGTLITADERTRFERTAPTPDFRYRYRYIAVDQALRSAALLPPRSQAFAAVLCQAADWMMSTQGEDKTVAALYRIYVARGVVLPWAAHFGRDCPAPDFDAAARLLWTQPLAQARHAVRRHLGWLGAALAVAAIGVGWWGWQRRRPVGAQR